MTVLLLSLLYKMVISQFSQEPQELLITIPEITYYRPLLFQLQQEKTCVNDDDRSLAFEVTSVDACFELCDRNSEWDTNCNFVFYSKEEGKCELFQTCRKIEKHSDGMRGGLFIKETKYEHFIGTYVRLPIKSDLPSQMEQEFACADVGPHMIDIPERIANCEAAAKQLTNIQFEFIHSNQYPYGCQYKVGSRDGIKVVYNTDESGVAFGDSGAICVEEQQDQFVYSLAGLGSHECSEPNTERTEEPRHVDCRQAAVEVGLPFFDQSDDVNRDCFWKKTEDGPVIIFGNRDSSIQDFSGRICYKSQKESKVEQKSRHESRRGLFFGGFHDHNDLEGGPRQCMVCNCSGGTNSPDHFDVNCASIVANGLCHHNWWGCCASSCNACTSANQLHSSYAERKSLPARITCKKYIAGAPPSVVIDCDDFDCCSRESGTCNTLCPSKASIRSNRWCGNKGGFECKTTLKIPEVQDINI